MERYAHVTARQQRAAADLLELAMTDPQSVTRSVTESSGGAAESRLQSPEEGNPRASDGSGGRIRTYDQAVNSRPLYH